MPCVRGAGKTRDTPRQDDGSLPVPEDDALGGFQAGFPKLENSGNTFDLLRKLRACLAGNGNCLDHFSLGKHIVKRCRDFVSSTRSADQRETD